MKAQSQITERNSQAASLLPTSLLQRKKGSSCMEEKCWRKPQMLKCRAVNDDEVSEVPPIVHEVFRSPGQPLDPESRAFMEPRFGHDFSKVRVHADAKAAESAQEVNALAYTVGKDVVFGEGQHAMGTSAGRKLMAHELTHVVQQQRGSGGGEAESLADAAAERIISGRSVTPEMTGSASPGLYAQDNEEKRPRITLRTEPAFRLDWEALSQFGLSPWVSPIRQPGQFQLTSPSLRMSPPVGSSFGPSALMPPAVTPSGLIPPTILSPGSQPGLRPLHLTPPPSTTPSSASSPEAPSRLPIVSTGQFSLGLRLSFPEIEACSIPDASPSALKESMRRAEIMSQTLSGRIPTGWEAVDKAQLARAVWGIFSTHIAPDLARRVSSSLSTHAGSDRTSYELDLVILSDFSGGGISFTIRHP